MRTTMPARPRVGIEVLVTVIPEGGRSHLGKTANLSPSGMLLEVASPIEIGHRLQLKLFVPGTNRRLEVAGEVTRDAGRSGDSYRYGVRFLELGPEAVAELEKFTAERLDRHRPG